MKERRLNQVPDPSIFVHHLRDGGVYVNFLKCWKCEMKTENLECSVGRAASVGK